MTWLNHHHLLYFWTVAREGSIVRASEVLNLTPQTISAQIHSLEDALGERLFERVGRGLVLTETGEVAKRYADDIFALSQELVESVQGQSRSRPRQVRVGVADALPKLICYRLLAPALRMRDQVQLYCREEGVEALLGELAVHRLDLVLTDTPLPPTVSVRAYNHLLGESPVVWLGSPELCRRYGSGFPRSLDGAPVLLPTSDTALRRTLDLWFDRVDVRPKIIGEFVDSSLLKTFGEAGEGVFPAPGVIVDEVRGRSAVELLGVAEGAVERFYAISVERKVRHPAVAAICNAARMDFLAPWPQKPDAVAT